MKKITSILIFLFFSTNLFSQNYIDYTKLKGLLFKKGGNITVEFLKSQTIKRNKENEVKELINLNSEFYNNLSTYKGKDIYRKCKSLRENCDYWNNQVKRVKEGLLDDKKEVNRATNDYARNSYITRYNNGVKRHKEYIKKRDNYVSDYNYCHKSEVEKSKRQFKRLTVLEKEMAAFYIEKWNNKTIIAKTPTKKYNIESDDKMQWNSGSLDDLLRKAKDNETMAFAFICNSDKEICQKTYNEYFKVSTSDTWSSKNGLVNFLNRDFIAGKFNTNDVSSFMKRNNITHYPSFIWFKSDGIIIEKATGKDTDIYGISKKLINQPNSEIDNFEENIKKKGCDDLFCYYTELHRVFLKTPDSRKDGKLYELIKYNPGNLNSPELQWLLNYSEFKELDSKDKMKIFNRALEFSYIKETGDYELSDAYNSYANDEKLKPLGKHAKAFKDYLIAEEEGLGFLNVKNNKLIENNYKSIPGRTLEIKKFNNSDNIKHIGYIDDKTGKRIGKWIWYYQTGTMLGEYKHTTEYQNIEELKEYYDNEKISVHATEIKGKYILNWTHYYKNGNIKSKGNAFRDRNKKTDFWQYYHENGKLSSEGSYNNSGNAIKHKKWTYYNKDGLKTSMSNYTSYKDYTSTLYYPNGKISNVQTYIDDKVWRLLESCSIDGKQTLKKGNGIYKVYNKETNQLEHTAEITNGVRDGIANWYYKNGQLEQSVLYKYSDKFDCTGLRWEILAMFDMAGNSLKKGTLKNGNGTWRSYDEIGFLKSVSNYTNGIKNQKK